ncbi:MAG: hypothetical protein C0518_09120 [Opitutus sp.]|nr:hypothetical protein [Opitutus sp.]
MTLPTIFDTLAYQFTGLAVVFTALGLIWGLLELIGLVFRRSTREVESAVVPLASEVPAADVLTPAVVAAIGAAVHETLGPGKRIKAIVPVATPDWAREGRRQIFSSHQPR